MSPSRRYVSDEAKVVHLAQQFNPSYFREYLMWTAVWRQDEENGRGELPPPVGRSLMRGAGIFWQILDRQAARVQCFHANVVRVRLEARLAEEE